MPMKLAISSRIVEKFRDKRQANMGLEELAELSASEGYAALCMRASQLGTQTPIEQVREQYQLLTQRGLQVSMVTGDFPIPENTDEGPQKTRIRSCTRSKVSWKFVQLPELSLMATTLSRSASRSATEGVNALPALPGIL